MPVFLSIGECMIELSSLGGDIMRKGFAGDTFNTAWYAKAFLPQDWSVEYFTARGDDRASGEMADFMASAGIGTSYIRQIPGKSPGLYMIHLDGGERSFSYWRSTSAARSLADDRAQLRAAMDTADVIYFSGITLAILTPESRLTLLDLAKEQKDKSKTVAFDPNIRPRLWTGNTEMLEVITDAARVSTLVLPGFDDEAKHFGDTSVEATIERYHRLGASSVIVKDGAKGATLSTPTGSSHIKAVPPGHVVDTTSAGDSFNAGYLARLAAGDSPIVAATFAARLASAVIGHPGALIDRRTLGL